MQIRNSFEIDFDKIKNLPWINLLFAVAIGFMGASGLSLFLSTKVLFPNPEALKSKAISRERPLLPSFNPSIEKESIDSIIERNIFNIEGKTGEESDVKIEAPVVNILDGEKILKSTLPLKLKGTIYTGDPYSGLAFIEESNQKTQNSFLVGAMIYENIELIEIHREKIILLHNEQKEYIELEKEDIQKNRRRKQSNANTRQKISVNEDIPEVYKEEGFERNGNKITMSKDFRKKLLTTDFAKMLQDAKAEPFLVGGELNGFRLTRIKDDSIYQKSGLQESDIVKEINGVSLVDTAQAIKLLNSLRGEKELEIRILRNGSAQTINLQIR